MAKDIAVLEDVFCTDADAVASRKPFSEPFALASISREYSHIGSGMTANARLCSFFRHPRAQTGANDRLEASPDFWRWCEITSQTRDAPFESGTFEPLSYPECGTSQF